jgi:hypothetical protein
LTDRGDRPGNLFLGLAVALLIEGVVVGIAWLSWRLAR